MTRPAGDLDMLMGRVQERAEVCHVITGLETGGAERSLYLLLQGEVGRLFRHRVISLTGAGSYGAMIRDLGIPVTALEMRGRPWRLLRLRLSRMIGHPALVQGWMYHGNIAASLAGWRRARVVWNIRHSLEDLAGESPGTRRAIALSACLSRRPDRILYNSHQARAQHEASGFSATAAQVIPNGIDATAFAPDAAARGRLRRELGLGQTDTVLCHVGRCHPVKGHKILMDAVLPHLRAYPDLHLVMAGAGVSYDNSALAAPISENLRMQVHLLGERRDIPDLMAGSDLFALPSLSEGFPNVLGEAMAAGLAAVASDVGDCARVLGQTGRIVPPRDSQALSAAIAALLEAPDQRRALGQAARRRVVAEYPLDLSQRSYADLYRALLAPREV
ncbi:MAG: glycosyltransferase [Pseudomonadota bacterium]